MLASSSATRSVIPETARARSCGVGSGIVYFAPADFGIPFPLPVPLRCKAGPPSLPLRLALQYLLAYLLENLLFSPDPGRDRDFDLLVALAIGVFHHDAE